MYVYMYVYTSSCKAFSFLLCVLCRRWRLVLNVKKFESTVRQSAGIDRISSDLLEKFTGYKDTSEARRKVSSGHFMLDVKRCGHLMLEVKTYG